MKLAFVNDFEIAAEAAAPDFCAAYPLVLDLDGTLLRTDLLLELILQFIKREPWNVLLLLVWCWGGIANLKYQLARRCDVSVDLLPVNEPLARYAREAAEHGRQVVAATAASRELAAKVCGRFSFISEILASDERVNLKSISKRDALTRRFPAGFAYAGNSAADLPVWRAATFGLFAGTKGRLLKQVQQATLVEADFSRPDVSIVHWINAVRLHQWAKNGLVFVPLVLAGHFLDGRAWLSCALTFIAIGLAASATYLINDLLDLEADRQHWTKRARPFASGCIPIAHGCAGAAVLLSAGLGLAFMSGGLPVFASLLGYCAVTVAYSLRLKRVPILDVTILAALFTARLGIGSIAAHVSLSAWLGVFSMFLFLSLALAKRSTEISGKSAAGPQLENGRGYLACDAPLISSLGVSAAVASVLLLVLYLINDAFAGALYRTPQLLWGAPVFISLWLGRIWLLCGRGALNDDPVAFAVTDRPSLCLALGVLASFAAAAVA